MNCVRYSFKAWAMSIYLNDNALDLVNFNCSLMLCSVLVDMLFSVRLVLLNRCFLQYVSISFLSVCFISDFNLFYVINCSYHVLID